MRTPDTSPSLSLREKYALVEEGRKRQMKDGEFWYLVSRSWFRRWEKAMTGEQDKEGGVDEKDLGPVDNSPLLDASGQLVKAPVEGVDTEFFPVDIWDVICSWYGKPEHTIRRQVVTLGVFQETCLELHPLRLKVFRLTDNLNSSETSGASEQVTYASITRQVKDLLQDLARAIHPSFSEEFRVWRVTSGDDLHGIDYPSGLLLQQNTEILEPSDETLPDALIESEDSFVVEFAQGGKWIMTELPPLATQGGGFFGDAAVSTTGSPANEPGALGLGNLGNTCFMNSALQCLSHIQELSDYFTTGAFEGELNRENPLGMKGAIAETFGALLRRIWSTTSPVAAYSPRKFKSVLQRFAPQFSGYHQQDSQELVAFLLDGLHEDLNRVKERPYVEKPEWQGGGDLELVQLARESWEGYVKRNNSVIVDLFQGQYKSTLVCPECKKVSITFDPFMYLTLPIPAQKKWRHTIFYIPWDTAKPPVKVPVEINRTASFRDLRNLLGRWMDANPDNLLTVEIFAHRIYKNLDDSVLCGELSEDDTVFCYELPSHAQQARSYANQQTENDPFIVPVFLRGTAVSDQDTQATSLFAHPFVVAISAGDAHTVEGIKNAVAAQLQRWVSGGQDAISTPDSAFSLKLQANNKDFGASFSAGPNGKKEESWEDRQLAGDPVLLRPNDALYLDFSEAAKARFFPAAASAAPVPWDASTWETFAHPEYEELLRISAEKKDQSITLQDCLDEFTKEERLGEDDPWYCPRCQKHQQAAKKFDLWSVPDVLVVHLKRFSSSHALRDKIEMRVDFPVRGLDLSGAAQQRQVARKLQAQGVDVGALGLSADDVEEPLVYDLYAVSEHRSSELEQGHYTSDAYNHITGRWYHFADEKVTPSQPESAVNEDAYLLFYKLRTSRPLGGKTHSTLQEPHS